MTDTHLNNPTLADHVDSTGQATALHQNRLGTGKAWYHFIILSVFAFGSGFLIGIGSDRIPAPRELPSMSQCTKDWLSSIQPKQPLSIENMRDIAGQCYTFIREQGLLDDFTARSTAYSQQNYANRVILWMVVLITLSGVTLAAMQLIATYTLASTSNDYVGKPDELVFQRDRVILKSSITGLFILIVSFAFFLVFVVYVYRFDDTVTNGESRPRIVTLPDVKSGLMPPSTAQPLVKPATVTPSK